VDARVTDDQEQHQPDPPPVVVPTPATNQAVRTAIISDSEV